jgi:Mrp family chromosome partitioning ATPase
VVVDAPALLERGHGALPGAVAAAAAEATLLVVLAGRTAASSLREARAALDGAGARLAGVAMNDRDNPRLAAEMARQARRLARFAPRLHGGIERALRGSSLLGLRV